MSNIRELKTQPAQTAAEGLRAIAKALESGELKEPPYALVVFGFDQEDTMLNVIPVGRRPPNSVETVGMLTIAASAVGFGEAGEPSMLPIEP